MWNVLASTASLNRISSDQSVAQSNSPRPFRLTIAATATRNKIIVNENGQTLYVLAKPAWNRARSHLITSLSMLIPARKSFRLVRLPLHWEKTPTEIFPPSFTTQNHPPSPVLLASSLDVFSVEMQIPGHWHRLSNRAIYIASTTWKESGCTCAER